MTGETLDERDEDDAAIRATAATQATTLLPAVLWALGAWLFDDGQVPVALQGAIGFGLTIVCTIVARGLDRLADAAHDDDV